ncbi:MAG: hypothetical protein U1E61_02260 [Bradyrhizobium sp.]
MGASPIPHEYSAIGRLLARMKRLAGRSDASRALRRMDDRQIGQIAHEFGLSRSQLFALCANRASGSLLRQRLAEFGLGETLLAERHPEVLQDMQRVCGTCSTTSHCADDFAHHRDSGRDGYCPNTCTLYALKQEGLARKNDSGCCGT